MKLDKAKFRFISVSFLCFLLLLGGNVNAQKKRKKKKKPKYEINAKFGATYDDNILKYSDKYLERFMNREDEGRFQIETHDDVYLKTSLGAAATYRFIKKRNTRFSANISRSSYVKNPIKDWSMYGFGIQQDIAKRASFKLSYSNIPEFYVRHFRDKHWVEVYGYEPITFKPYAFGKENYAFWIQNTFFKNTRIRLSLAYMRYLHNKHFTEYDCDNMLYGIKVFQKLNKKLKVDFGYNYITSDAKGYDESFETKENNNSPDATYIEDQFSLGFNYSLPKVLKKRNYLDVEARAMNRYYLTDKYIEEDKLHAGRYDENLRFYFKYNIRLSKSIDISAFYNYLIRDTETSSEINREDVSEEKDYFQNVAGFEVKYSFGF